MSVPGNLYTPTIRKTRGGDYLIEQSLLFDGSAYLSRTPGTAGNRKTFTFSCWFKRAELGGNYAILGCVGNANMGLYFDPNDRIALYAYYTGAVWEGLAYSTAKLRDTSSWYHVAWVVDTTNATAADRQKLYINGERADLTVDSNLGLNRDLDFNSTVRHKIGSDDGNSMQFDGLMALPILVDGAALDPTSFGELDDDGYWNPIEYTGATVDNFVIAGDHTIIGNMTETSGAGGIGAAFDDDTTQTDTEGAKTTVSLNTADATVGLQFSSSKKITQVCTTGASNRGYATGSYTGSLTIYLKSSNSGIGVSETTHDSVTFNNSNATNPKTLTGDGSSATYWWVEIQGATGELGLMAEVQMYEEATAGFGTNGGQYDFNNSSFFGQDVKQEFTAPSVAFTDSAYDSTNTTSYTFSSMDIGAADDDRYVYACVGASNTAVSPLTFQTVTIGGVSATQLGASNADPTYNLQPYAIYVAKVPSGTTADVVVTLNSSPGNCAVALYRAVGVGLGYVDLQSDNGSSPNSVSVDVPANGFILAHGNKNGQATRVTMTGVTEQYDFGGESDMAIFGGLNTAAGGTTQTVTVTTASGSYFGHLAVTIPPAGDNSYIANNFTADDQFSDSPTDSADDGFGNRPTLNPNDKSTSGTFTFSNGNRTVTQTGSDVKNAFCTMSLPTTGKIYFECYWSSVSGDPSMGITTTPIWTANAWKGATNGIDTADADKWLWNGDNFFDETSSTSYSGFGPDASAYEKWAIDLDTGKVWSGNSNNGWANSGDPAAGTGELATIGATELASGLVAFIRLRLSVVGTVNFGQVAFNETPPTGFSGWSTADFAAPTIADGSDYFNTVLYTGDASAQSVTGVGFQPDLVWIKDRDTVSSHPVWDSVRGVSKRLLTDATTAEQTASGLTSFDVDGFTVGTSTWSNNSGADMVAWCWKAGGTAVSNTDGSITSSVSANPTAGFSIVTYTGIRPTTGTVGHGLDEKPDMIIFKNRADASQWYVWHKDLANQTTYVLFLNSTVAQQYVGTSTFNNTAPTSTVFSLGNDSNVNDTSDSHVAYCWHSVEGFSKFGSYTGNGSADGPFIYTGFRPAFLLIRNTGVDNWIMLDTRRNTYNPANTDLYPNLSNGESTASAVDILSNGFKPKDGNTVSNANSGTYIYMAFAEVPFQGDDGYTQARAR